MNRRASTGINSFTGECHLPEETKQTESAAAEKNARDAAKSRDEVALELMKFIAVTTGYGKGTTAVTGFSRKASKTSDEYADALLQLFGKCRDWVGKK